MSLILRRCDPADDALPLMWLAGPDRPLRAFAVLTADDRPRVIRVLLGIDALFDRSGFHLAEDPSRLRWFVGAFWGEIEACARSKYQPPRRIVLLSDDLVRRDVLGSDRWRWTVLPPRERPSQPVL